MHTLLQTCSAGTPASEAHGNRNPVGGFLRVLVLGCGDIGAAVAHRLHLFGCSVVLHDMAEPANTRRGMDFTDALFDGVTVLAGVVARRIDEASQIAVQARTCDAIPVTTQDVVDVLACWSPHILVDARMRKHHIPDDLRGLAATTFGLGPGYAPGENCDIAIETALGDSLGAVLCFTPARPHTGEPRSFDGYGRERYVHAGEDGVWVSEAHIGQRVRAGQTVGWLNGVPVGVPLNGVLRGLSHSGVAVRRGRKVVEIDPRDNPDAFGLGQRPVVIARGVSRALGLDLADESLFFGFEASYRANLDCIPMSMRAKLDLSGVHLKLDHWRALPKRLRETLLEAPLGPRTVGQRLGLLLHCLDLVDSRPLTPPTAPPNENEARLAVEQAAGMSLGPSAWKVLQPLQRYALLKLAQGHRRDTLHAALAEFCLSASDQ